MSVSLIEVLIRRLKTVIDFCVEFFIQLDKKFSFPSFFFFPGMSVNGFTNIFLLTLERRFHLTSTEVGFIAASNDIAGIVLTSLVSFYGTYGNKIKWLGYGSVVTGKLRTIQCMKSKTVFA